MGQKPVRSQSFSQVGQGRKLVGLLGLVIESWTYLRLLKSQRKVNSWSLREDSPLRQKQAVAWGCFCLTRFYLDLWGKARL
jgi:hypothetical protein